MILYFDNLITNIPQIKNYYTELDKLRASCKAYSTSDKFDITLYTLASYSVIPWSKVIIRYELQDPSRKKEFEKFARNLFPKADIKYGRSDNIEKYRKVLETINEEDDDWIFYAGNSDEPFIAPNLDSLNVCLDKAKELSKNNEYVSVLYAHYIEGLHLSHKGNALHDISYRDASTIEENDDFIVAKFKNGWVSACAIEIMNKKLLNDILDSKKIPEDKVFWKIEHMYPYVKIKNQIVVLPKKIIGEHFDGHSHNTYSGHPITSSKYPALFIPTGFFNKKIRIRYGYNDYKEGWVNINPVKEKYSFEDKNGTDLKISIDEIPLFWKSRISKIDKNKKLKKKDIVGSIKIRDESYDNMFLTPKDRGYFLHILKYRTRNMIFNSKLFKPIHNLYKKSKLLKSIKRKLNDRMFK